MNGIWSDGITLWALEKVPNQTFHNLNAYNMLTKARENSKTIRVNPYPYHLHPNGAWYSGAFGIWSDGITIWVVQRTFSPFAYSPTIIQAYNIINRNRDSDKDILSPRGHIEDLWFVGIWSDGTTMWVTDRGQKLLAYSLETLQRDPSKEFSIDIGYYNYLSFIWSDGQTIWESNLSDEKIYAYNMLGVRDGYSIPFESTTQIDSTTQISPPEARSNSLSAEEEPEPAPLSAVATHCIASAEGGDGEEHISVISLGGTIIDVWSGGCPSVTRGGRMAKYYTFSLPHTTAVEIALKSHLDDYLVLRRGDLGGTIVARDDDSGDGNDSLISETLPSGGYTIEATTFYMDGVEAEFTLEANAVDRVLYSGPASGKATPHHSPTDTVLDIRLLPTLPLPRLQITIMDDDGFGAGQPGAAEMLLQGRIETDVGSPGSVMLAVPNDVWVGHGDITVHTRTSAEGSPWEEHTAEDGRELLEEVSEGSGGFFGFLGGLVKTISSLVRGSNPLDTIAGWLKILAAGRSTVQGEDAAMLGLGASPVSQIFQGNHANCFSQVSVPWLVEEEEVTGVRISIPVILTDSEYVSVGAEFIARESGENEQSLVEAHDLLSTGDDAPACQRP